MRAIQLACKSGGATSLEIQTEFEDRLIKHKDESKSISKKAFCRLQDR
jgi:hypothetical protein